jgi:hypothetical protein
MPDVFMVVHRASIILARERKRLHGWIKEASDDEALGGNEVFLAARPALMSGAWASKDSAEAVTTIGYERSRRSWSACNPTSS